MTTIREEYKKSWLYKIMTERWFQKRVIRLWMEEAKRIQEAEKKRITKKNIEEIANLLSKKKGLTMDIKNLRNYISCNSEYWVLSTVNKIIDACKRKKIITKRNSNTYIIN